MEQIATKFVKWRVPKLITLRDCPVYKVRERLNNGGRLSVKKGTGSPET